MREINWARKFTILAKLLEVTLLIISDEDTSSRRGGRKIQAGERTLRLSQVGCCRRRYYPQPGAGVLQFYVSFYRFIAPHIHADATKIIVPKFIYECCDLAFSFFTKTFANQSFSPKMQN